MGGGGIDGGVGRLLFDGGCGGGILLDGGGGGGLLPREVVEVSSIITSSSLIRTIMHLMLATSLSIFQSFSN